MSQPNATRPMLPKPSSLYRSCIEEAALQGRAMLQRAISVVEKSLGERVQRAPDAQQRQFVHDAISLLHRHGATIADQFADALLTRFAGLTAGTVARGAGSLKFAELELVDEGQVLESVEVLRAQQVVAGMVEAELVMLNALVCAAQGLPTVQADRNPMRPEVYVGCLRDVVQALPVPQPVRVRWMQYLGEALGPELAISYKSLIAKLHEAGVSAASFQIIPGAQAPAGRRGSGMAPAPATATSMGFGAAPAMAAPLRADATSQTLLTVRALQRLLAGELDAPAADAVRSLRAAAAPLQDQETDYPETIPAAIGVLQEMRQVDAVLQRLRERERDAGGTGSAAYRDAVKREARRPGQAIALEVVSLMVENIAGDSRLLPPIADAVRVLEPALLRLALADPRFFSNPLHPARRLLDEMTSRSLAWPSVDEPGFDAFVAPLREAVDVLVSTHVSGPEPYKFALQVLDEAWTRGQTRDRRRREKAVRTLMRAEQRNLLAARVAREVGERVDVVAAPGEVSAFLRGPWSQVIAHAQLGASDGDSDPGGYRAAVPELLWSVQPHTTAVAVARLSRRLPALLETLQGGMRLVGYTQGQVRRFFERLQALQQAAMKGIATPPGDPDASLASLERLLGPVLAEDGAWLAPAEAQQSGFLESQPGTGQPLFLGTQGADRAPRPDGAQGGSLQLPPGAWIDVQIEGSWSRWQLVWSSPHRTLWMFTDSNGDTHSMRPGLATAMHEAGTLRVVSGERVVDDALDAVAGAALLNDAEFRVPEARSPHPPEEPVRGSAGGPAPG